MLSPLLTSLSIWDPFVSIGSTIIQPLYWVVSGILVLFHSRVVAASSARATAGPGRCRSSR